MAFATFDASITRAEQGALKRFDDPAMRATGSTVLLWTAALDDKGRRLIRLLAGDGRDCVVEVTLDELNAMTVDDFKRAIIGGERPCKQPSTG